jgi:serine/threonine-protein kinase
MASIPTKIGRYDIIELVGRGGMGVLYRARDRMLERDVALKMMHVDFSVDSAARERFEREAKAVARLQHRNVVTIHELGSADGSPYIVMEFLSGQDLDVRLRDGAPMSLVEKLDVAIQLCEGLGYAHEQGIVHRDIKPGNVRVLEDGTVKILDFGIAKFAVNSVTQSGSILGTPSYMAPEQVMGQPVDGRADLFSAGVLLYELLSGKKPFTGDAPTAVVYQIMHVEPPPIHDVVPELPEALNEIVSRALMKNPNERYARASEMAADLQMVKMMLYLPLSSGVPGTSSGNTGKLNATLIREKTGAGGTAAALNQRMRGSAVAAVADAAPRAGAEDHSKKSMAWIVGAIGVVVLGIVAYLAMGGRSNPPAAAAAASPSAPAAGAAENAAPAPASADGAMVISSTPSGAAIKVNGVDTGKVTPAAVSVGTGAERVVELSLSGYDTMTASLTDAEIAAGKKEFRLSRPAGPVRLVASAPFPFELVQGSKVLSAMASTHEVTLQPGSAAVTARNRELLLNSPLSVDFQRPRMEVNLQALGSLTVYSSGETCSIIVDGQDLGFPPIVRKPAAGQLPGGPEGLPRRRRHARHEQRRG